MLIIFSIFLLFITSVQSFTDWDLCHHPQLQKNFNASRHAGEWFEAARSKSVKTETGDCVTFRFTQNEEGTMKIMNSQRVGLKYKSIEGSIYCDAIKSGQCWVKFFSFQPWDDYEVVYTDYERVSVVYSCSLYMENYSNSAWVLVRDISISPETYLEYLKVVGFKDSDFVYTNQRDCPGRENL